MTLQRYNLKVQFVKRKENIVADTLSRAAIRNESTNQSGVRNHNIFEVKKDTRICQMIEEVVVHKNLRITPQRIDQIKEATRRDSTMQRLVSYITTGWPTFKKCTKTAKFTLSTRINYQRKLVLFSEMIKF